MKWLHFMNVPMYINKDGKVRQSEPWIDCEEMIADSGKRKGIRMMGMTISIVEGVFIQPDEMLYLHFKGQDPIDGIRIGYISTNENGEI